MNRHARILALSCAALALALPLQSLLAGRPTGRFIDLIDQAMRDMPVRRTDDARTNRGAASSDSTRLLVENWNPQGCGFTDHAQFSLPQATRLDRIDLWYNWAQQERSSRYRLANTNGRVFAEGLLARDSCDPYQGAWCVATGSPRISLPAGSYTIQTERPRVCQNPASRGQGFIKAWGSSSKSSPGSAQVVPLLGSHWTIYEEIPGGRNWKGSWIRGGSSNTFDAQWRDSLTGQSFTDVIELREITVNTVRLYRQGTKGFYSGTISPDRKSIRGGASWFPQGAFWTAQISRD